MPTRDELAAYRAALSGGRGYYQPPRISDYGDYGSGTLGALIGRQGAIQAQRQQAGADMLAQGFQQAFQGIGDYFNQREQKKEMAKRDAATMAAIEGWDGKDPMALFKSMHSVRGPQDALQYTNAVLSLRKGPQQDPQQELQRFGSVARWVSDHSDEEVAKAWPFIRQSLGPTAGKIGLEAGEQWDPQFRGVIKPIGDLWGPKEELGVATPGSVIYDKATGQVRTQVPKEKEGKVVETVDAQGRPIMKEATPEELARGVPKYVPPKEPRAPNLQRIETVGPDGQTVQTFVEARAGASYPSPAKAPPQQRLTKDERSDFASWNYALPRIDSFANYVRSNPGKFGQWDAFAQGLKQQVPGFAEGEYASQDAFIGRLNAEIRHAMFGASLTEGEKESANAFLIQKTDQPEVIMSKLQEASNRARSNMDYYRQLGFTIPGAGGQAAPAGGGVPRVSSDADYAKLPSGAVFTGPDGKKYRKP